MRWMIAIVAVAALGCEEDATCQKVVEHTLSLMTPEIRAVVGTDTADLVAECERVSTQESRVCSMRAKSQADLVRCGPK